MFSLIRAAFLQRRKTLCNAMMHGLGLSRETAAAAIQSAVTLHGRPPARQYPTTTVQATSRNAAEPSADLPLPNLWRPHLRPISAAAVSLRIRMANAQEATRGENNSAVRHAEAYIGGAPLNRNLPGSLSRAILPNSALYSGVTYGT